MHYMLVNLLHSHYIQHVMYVITYPLHAFEDANGHHHVIISPANPVSDHGYMQPTQTLSPNVNSPLTIISSPIIPQVPQRCSRRLASKAEQAGGRLVYSHTEAPRVILR